MAETNGASKWATEQQRAWGLLHAGKGEAAVDLLTRQVGEIEKAGGEAREKALSLIQLGRVMLHAGQAERALEPLMNAIEGFEAAGDRASLSAALGDLSNALRMVGKLDEALTCAEKVVALARERSDGRNEASALGQMAGILTDQQRVGEAEQRYEEALAVARKVGDGGLEGLTLLHLGTLAMDRGEHALAVTRSTEALARFKAAEDKEGEMQTADLLGSAEMELGHHDAARASFVEAQRLAQEFGDERQLGATAQNLGILLKRQALALPDGAKDERQRLLGEAASAVSTSLAIDEKRGDAAGAAASHFQLGVIDRLLGDLDDAERHVQQALSFYEPNDLPDVLKVYASLEAIAVARDRPEEAAAWRAKKDAKQTELDHPAGEDGSSRLDPQVRQIFLSICQTLHTALSTHQPIPDDLAETITNLIGQADPLGAAGRFLQRLASGEHPDPPGGLPTELTEIFAALVLTLRAIPPAAATPAPHASSASPETPAAAPTICPCGSGKLFAECHGAGR